MLMLAINRGAEFCTFLLQNGFFWRIMKQKSEEPK